MAQYSTDFSEYTTGSKPSDWTERVNASGNYVVQADSGAVGGKVLRLTDPESSQ